ncbi:hypothetical protein TI39_contig4209g00001 [Zymoseptoria brevis]|uniref:Large ribosomal subunit protein bL27m n=1 Tax=Zymoseptoria brevis TaxID=1047168 RepID=A0A0F4GDC1_9PEZI|nr:hypothetical protein TI39_contig4209g00001 [Zymoseptoria brevis]
MASRMTPRAPSMAALSALDSALTAVRISGPSTAALGRRHASHQAQGRANGAKDGAGKRLGAKKAGGEYVVPGNILYKQRGTLWFPGDNCIMGRDHTIHAGAPGYVRYYRDPARHPKRKYIGVVFQREQTLPQPPNAARRRLLGRLAYEAPTQPAESWSEISENDLIHPPRTPNDAAFSATQIHQQPNDVRDVTIKRGAKGDTHDVVLHMRGRGQYRQSNWEIGRAAEHSAAAQNVRKYERGNRWLAWRKANARKLANAERRNMVRKGAKKAKK